jgi:hypothetical protein
LELLQLREVFSKVLDAIIFRITRETTKQVLDDILGLLGLIVGLAEVFFHLPIFIKKIF